MTAVENQSFPVLILGAGGHAKVLIEALHHLHIPIKGITSADLASQGQAILGETIIGGDDKITYFSPDQIRLVNGLGSIGDSLVRRKLYESWRARGYFFAKVVHPAAVVAADVVMEDGVQIMAGAVVQPGTIICANSIVNTRTSVDHDCHIDAHVHLAPGVTLSGGVHVGENTHLGTGATVIQGVKIGRNCLVAAGALVVNDVDDGMRVKGVPGEIF